MIVVTPAVIPSCSGETGACGSIGAIARDRFARTMRRAGSTGGNGGATCRRGAAAGMPAGSGTNDAVAIAVRTGAATGLGGVGGAGGDECADGAAAAWTVSAGARAAVSNESVSRPLGSGDDDANAAAAVSSNAIANNTWPGWKTARTAQTARRKV
ncbi:hypothetical protein [Burkholderia cepacia]|uniref:hypothetical protein n=1 Tax=Burkholderia cepacia TaxID=292 RepID=UPI001E4E17B4|nr:hypothetical protein [Burkholderia cepacia]